MKKIKISAKRLQFKSEKIVVLTTEDTGLLRGGASVPDAQCGEGRTDILIWSYYSQYFCEGPLPAQGCEGTVCPRF